MSVVLYGCETVSHNEGGTQPEGVREEGAEEGYGPEGDEVRGEWTGLHNEELYDLYCSPYIIQVIQSRIKWARLCGTRGENEWHTGLLCGELRGETTWETQEQMEG